MADESTLPDINLTKSVLLYEQQVSGLYLPKWQGCTNDAAHVRPISGPQTPSNNRQLLAVPIIYSEADCRVHWDKSKRITSATIFISNTTGLTRVLMSVDAGSAASAWLDPALDSGTEEAMFESIPIGVWHTIEYTNIITDLDFLPVGATPDIWVGGH